MPSSKTDTAMRFPESVDQQTRLRNTTQDKKSASRAQAQASTGKKKAEESTTLSPNQLLAEHMNAAGDPVPDPVTYGGSARMKSDSLTDEPDVFEAMNAETADFD
ncbi:hypothetical protein N7462_004483 [Penicillium macrosclerotiorum]|uniref:uncharacterized protein n=1 Tax=Penicillium macrosclerotiorum TaxID=303699 RepID=UPI002549A3FE|nr:uncharacterized protein N7462_004483 [Penicillium macrosclerotiorum]KAJ5690091.1 hypothetical protein N7462_004483 [Penicillium macrosclerotiorum]